MQDGSFEEGRGSTHEASDEEDAAQKKLLRRIVTDFELPAGEQHGPGGSDATWKVCRGRRGRGAVKNGEIPRGSIRASAEQSEM